PCRSVCGWRRRYTRLAVVCSFAAPFHAKLAVRSVASLICVAHLRRSFESITHRLAGLQHAHDPFLRLLRAEPLDERAALEREQHLFIDQAAGFDVSATQHLRDAARDQEVVLADEAAIAHVDELRLDRR